MTEWSCMHRDCPFCLEAQNPEYANALLGADWPFNGRLLHQNEGMFVVPGIGPQVYPYLLAISRRHFTSLASSSARERQNLFEILNVVLASAIFPSGAITVFEHGGCHEDTSSCISHFHLHLVDASFDLVSALSDDFPTREVDLSMENDNPNFGRYLCAASFTGGERLKGRLASPLHPESQYFRKLIAEMTGQHLWDWRVGMNKALMVRAMRSLAPKQA
jgi:diadenosine tetraphosphate (Ap4A) HIT family hydrolase